MNIDEQIMLVLSKKSSKRTKMYEIKSILAERERDFIYRHLEEEKAKGPKWIEDVRKQARMTIEKSTTLTDEYEQA